MRVIRNTLLSSALSLPLLALHAQDAVVVDANEVAVYSPLNARDVVQTDRDFWAQSQWGGLWVGSKWTNQPEYTLNSYASLIQQEGNAGGLIFRVAPAGSPGQSIAWTDAMRIDVNGNLGVGVMAPTDKLHVAGTTRLDGEVAVSGRILMAQPTFGTSEKLSFWNPSTTGHSIGLEGWWNVWRAHQTVGWKFKDEAGRDKVEVNGGWGLGASTVVVHPSAPNHATEGAEVTLKAAPSFADWRMDVYHDQLRIFNYATSGVQQVNMFSVSGGTTELRVQGSLVATDKQFVIDHPKDPTNQNLRHVSIEAPRGDLIYRGRVNLKNGRARVDLDASARMTGGTFDVLTRDAQVFLQNDSSWSALKGRVRNGTLVISCEDASSTDEVSWMVVAERADKAYLEGGLVGDDGKFVTELAKPELPAESLLARDGAGDGFEAVPEAVGKRGYYRRPDVFAPGAEMPKRETRKRIKEYREQRKEERKESRKDSKKNGPKKD